MKYLFIYWIWIDCTIPITIEIFDLNVISQKNMDKFFIRMNISVLKKNILLKKYFHFKDDKNYVGGLYTKIHFICLSKC
jgi:hypothetical protein